MNNQSPKRKLTRRDFLKIGGGLAAGAAGIRYLPEITARVFLSSAMSAGAATRTFHLVGTDGFIALPGPSSIIADNPTRVVYPDPLAPSGRTTYIFGFRNVTGYTNQNVLNQKGKAQASAPLLWVDELDDVKITLTNLGLQIRPDLFDSHTIHFHGFRNAIPLFDGVPEMSIAVPIGNDFTYYYKPRDAGTYMYHCHFEDVEHVQMGMTGIVFVRPAQNKGAAGIPKSRLSDYGTGAPANAPMGYVYNDGVAPGQPGSTTYDREFGMFLTEMWASAHYDDAHIQVSDWSAFEPDFWLLNGRCYPDTLASGPTNGDPGATDTGGRLQYQPISSLVTCNAGEKVLLRFVSLGYQQAAMTLDGISMRIVGKDATLLRGFNSSGTARTGADLSYDTDTVYIGPGESYDAIFTAPAFNAAAAAAAGTPYNTYLLYNRNYAQMTNGGTSGIGGQATEVRVYPATGTSGARPKQTLPNTNP